MSFTVRTLKSTPRNAALHVQGAFLRGIYIKKMKNFTLKGIPVLNASALEGKACVINWCVLFCPARLILPTLHLASAVQDVGVRGGCLTYRRAAVCSIVRFMRTAPLSAMITAPPAPVWTPQCSAGRDALRLAAVMALPAAKPASLTSRWKM